MQSIVSREKGVLANGLRHHLRIWEPASSPAPTVLCCHGFLDASSSFRFFAEALVPRDYRVVAFDFRGHGRSQWVGAGGYYHFFDYVADLAALVEALDLQPLHLLGHSMGGTAAALYAGAFPERVHRLILVEGLGPEVPSEDPAARVRRWLEGVDAARARPARVFSSLREAAERIRRVNEELSLEQALAMAEGSTREVEGGSGLTWSYDPIHRTVGPYPFDSERFIAFLGKIRAPTLLVDGEKGMRAADQEKRRAALQDARTITLPGLGHMIHLTGASRLAEEVDAFLQRAKESFILAEE